MISSFDYSPANFLASVDVSATFQRLLRNLSGFLYRRRHDAAWTMEFVSSGVRDVTGYDPHRLIGNQSLAFADLIARTELGRVNAQVLSAARNRRRVVLDYHIRAAHGAWIQVEDRLTPVVNAGGRVLAIEGVIDRARWPAAGTPPRSTASAATRGVIINSTFTAQTEAS